MHRYFNLTGRLLPAFIFVVLLISCNEKEHKKKEETKVAEPPKVDLISGQLDELYVDRKSFEDIPNGKLVFVFSFTASDKPTLHGWHYKGILGGDFNVPPDIKLSHGKTSAVKYATGTYFGNVVISKSGRDDIEKMLKDKNADYVLFVPQQVDTYHIGYKIYVGTGDPAQSIKTNAIFPTEVDANPSPPKNY